MFTHACAKQEKRSCKTNCSDGSLVGCFACLLGVVGFLSDVKWTGGRRVVACARAPRVRCNIDVVVIRICLYLT